MKELRNTVWSVLNQPWPWQLTSHLPEPDFPWPKSSARGNTANLCLDTVPDLSSRAQESFSAESSSPSQTPPTHTLHHSMALTCHARTPAATTESLLFEDASLWHSLTLTHTFFLESCRVWKWAAEGDLFTVMRTIDLGELRAGFLSVLAFPHKDKYLREGCSQVRKNCFYPPRYPASHLFFIFHPFPPSLAFCWSMFFSYSKSTPWKLPLKMILPKVHRASQPP